MLGKQSRGENGMYTMMTIVKKTLLTCDQKLKGTMQNHK